MPTQAFSLPAPTQGPTGQNIKVKISWYNPALGGVNCGHFVNGVCVSRMASGLPWQDYIGVAIACPMEVPFHTKIVIDGRSWECLDRGGAIKITPNGEYWVDMLLQQPIYKFGTVTDAVMYLP
jgi:hypothetical protein